MKKNTQTSNRIFSSVSRAAAGAMLSSSLAALLTVYLLPESAENGFFLGAVMVLGAAVTVLMELLSLPKAVSILIPVVSASVGAASLLVPRGEENGNLLNMLMNGNTEAASAILLPCLCFCVLLGAAVCMINRRFVLRCIIAGCAAIFMIVLIIMKMSLLPVVAVLLLAYVLVVACQAFAPKGKTNDAGRHEAWYVMICAAAVVTAMLLPAPETRIPWEKLVHPRHSQQLEMLGEALEIDSLDEQELPKTSGVDDDASDMGGWLETSASQPIDVSFSDGAFSDRLTGSLYDCYTGKGWLCTVSITDMGYAGFDDVSNADLKSLARATIKKISTSGETVFMPPYTVAIDSKDGFGTERSGSRVVFSTPHLGKYVAYFADSIPDCSLSQAERSAYLALPETLPARVDEFARLITSGKTDDAAKAEAIMGALSHYTYNTQVTSVPEESDFVDYFLFASREGYCEYFASAMAVLARCEGIPARIAIGYAVPNSKAETIRLTSANAHAWAELYIDGKGWVVYDPTAGAASVVSEEPEEQPEENGMFGGENLTALKKTLFFTYAAIGAAVALFFLFRPFVRRIISCVSIHRKYSKKSGYPVLKRCGRLMRTLSACGVKRCESETADEFSRRVTKECTWLSDDAKQKIYDLLSQSSAVLYSANAPDRKPVSGAARAVRRAFVRKHGILRFIRGWWKAEV